MIPTVKGMKAEGKPFKGVLFAGIMIKDGKIKTLEHNVRFGDPECQTVMMRLKSDLLRTLIMASEGRFRYLVASWSSRALCGMLLRHARIRSGTLLSEGRCVCGREMLRIRPRVDYHEPLNPCLALDVDGL